MSRVSIRHRTTYRYRNPVAFGEHRMMLRPIEGCDQRLIDFGLSITPTPDVLRHHQDAADAWVSVARFAERSDVLEVIGTALVDHAPSGAFDWSEAEAWVGRAPFAYEPDEAASLAESIARRAPDDGRVLAWARRFVKPVGRTRVAPLLAEMTRAICASFTYEQRLAGPPRSPMETLAAGAGCCRDFTVLLVEAARALGLAARFASGYVYRPGADGGGHTHAWARVYLPECGWMDFDPTNGAVGGAGLIRTAVAVEPRMATPLHGTWRGLRSDSLGMEVEIGVSSRSPEVLQPAVNSGVARTG